MKNFALLSLLPLVTLLTGCSASFSPDLTPNTEVVAGQPFSATVMGGRQPVAGAHIYLLAADTTGYGHASDSLFLPYTGSTSQTVLDTSGGPTNGYYYINTGATGALNVVSAEYNCTVGQAVYLYALGGNPGNPITGPNAGVNSTAAMMAVLGICEAGGNFAAIGAGGVNLSEVSTIAAAYSMAGFATDALHVSSNSTALSKQGLTNAFNNAANLYNISAGNQASANTKTVSGSGTVPAAQINMLANILAACVNSTGPTSLTCAPLLSHALSGGASGTAATDTATAAINMAHYPSHAVNTLFGLQGTVVPWLPNVTGTAPNDLSVAISFTDTSISGPYSVAIDNAGNAWVSNSHFPTSGAPVTEISSSGTVTSYGASNTNIAGPNGLAIDASDNVWFADASYSVFKMSSSGSFGTATAGFTSDAFLNEPPLSVAMDISGNVWTASQSGPVVEFSGGGADLTGGNGFAMPGRTNAYSVTTDTNGNAFYANNSAASTAVGGVFEFSAGGVRANTTPYGTSPAEKDTLAVATGPGNTIWAVNDSNNLFELNDSGTLISGGLTGVYSGGGLADGAAIAVDGAGSVWIANSGGAGVSAFTSAGVALSGSTGFGSSSGNVLGAKGVAIDGSGNVWVTSPGSSSVAELVGAATPVVTPIVASLVAPYSNAASKP